MKRNSSMKITHSIRTSYSLATAFFLLLVLAVFYVGGRVVLVHMMKDAEQQVRDIGYNISTLVYRNAESAKHRIELCADFVAEGLKAKRAPAEVIDAFHTLSLALAVRCGQDGAFLDGVAMIGGEAVALEPDDIAAYTDYIAKWMAAQSRKGEGTADSVGIMQVRGATYYVSLLKARMGGYMVIGTPFDSHVFSSQVNAGFGGLDVKITDRSTAVVSKPGEAGRNNAFGMAPILSEAFSFYTGGFWEIEQNSFKAAFAVRDIAGNAISMITVSLPQTMTTIARSALGRLTFFIATFGILVIMPLFWVQGRILLNPLSRMTSAIRELGDRHLDTDCPRLEWKGKDEFAFLAESVNRMLETISARTVRLAQLESRQRALIDGLPDALVVFDREGKIVTIYKQPVGTDPMPGFVMQAVPSSDVYGDKNVKTFLVRLGEMFDSGTTASLRFKSGGSGASGERHFEMRLSRMDGHFALGIIRDVTPEVEEHRLRLAAEKRAMDESKRESLTLLAAGIAHDVNNVLSVILSTVETAHAAIPPDTRSDESLRAVRDAVKRGSAMTRELMTFAGETRISLVRRSPSDVVDDVRRLAERTLGVNVAVSYSLAESLPDVDIDPNQFWKVIFNIVKNAGEAIGDRPGHVRISTEAFTMTKERADGFVSERPLQPGAGVLITISDDGPGVRPELLPRLFDPYVSSRASGRGLGLATVRTIVEAHGGGIRVASELEKGTTFSIFLPESHLASSASSVVSGDEGRGGEMPKEVLVVDNDEGILKTCAILLRSIGVLPHVARTRNEALGAIRRAPARIGAVLLDANLGAIDTVRLLEALRAASPSLRIVVSSGSREEEIRKVFAPSRFDFFLAKPYTIAELKASLA